MNNTSVVARQNIFNRIDSALKNQNSPVEEDARSTDDIVQPPQSDLLVHFAETFSSLQGNFSFCLSHKELAEQLNALLATRQWQKVYCAEPLLAGMLAANAFSQTFTNNLPNCDVAITTVEALVARTGSMVLSSAIPKGRTGSAYAPVHIAIAYAEQVVEDISDAISLLQQRYDGQIPSFMTFATGPSRTADIEKTLVTGVHGPAEVFCFVVDAAK